MESAARILPALSPHVAAFLADLDGAEWDCVKRLLKQGIVARLTVDDLEALTPLEFSNLAQAWSTIDSRPVGSLWRRVSSTEIRPEFGDFESGDEMMRGFFGD